VRRLQSTQPPSHQRWSAKLQREEWKKDDQVGYEEHVNFTETKTNKDRSVPMEPIVQEALLELRDQVGETEFVFTNPDTGTRYTDIKKSSQQHAEKRVSPISPFMTCVIRLAIG
jgi:hypothetical protein